MANSAVKAIFGADSRPMEAEFAKMEVVSKRFGKTIQDQYAAENAAMLKNRAALRELIAERKLAQSEAARYAGTIAGSAGGFLNPRASMAADQAAFAARLAEFKAMRGIKGASSAEKLAEAAEKSTGKIAGLNLVLRESIVLLREWGRGNYARMPGSASLVAQGLSQMGATGKAIAFLNKPLFNNTAANAEGAAAGKAAATGMIGALASIPLVAMAIVAGSLAALIAAPIIFFHRVKKLAGELGETLVSTFNPEHIAAFLSKFEILNQLHKEMAVSARHIQEAHDGVEDTLARQLELTKDRITFERELLEMKKNNELAAAKTPFEREAIEKKYSGLILAKKKEERDAEVKAMQDEVRQLPGEVKKAQDEITRLTGGGFFTSEADKQVLEQRKAASGAYDEYRKQLMPGEKDNRAYSADKDRAFISKIQQKQAYYNAHKTLIDSQGVFGAPYLVSDSENAKMAAAQARLKNAAATQQSVNAWMDSGDERERARKRVKELEDKVKDDSDRLAKLGPRGGGIIEDKIKENLQKDREDLALEKERMKRTDNPHGHEHGFGLSSAQRLGAYAATPPDMKKLVDAAVETAKNTSHLVGKSARPVGAHHTQFGPVTHGR